MARSNAQNIDRLVAQKAALKETRRKKLEAERLAESQLLKAQRRERHQRRVEIGVLADEAGLVVEHHDHYHLLIDALLLGQVFAAVRRFAGHPATLEAWVAQVTPQDAFDPLEFVAEMPSAAHDRQSVTGSVAKEVMV